VIEVLGRKSAEVRRRLAGSLVARNTFSMMAGSVGTILLQAVYFILIARCLGPQQYGAFVGAVSLIAVLSPFAAWGTGGILVRNVARQKESFPRSWGNALWMTAVSGSVLLLLVLLLSNRILSGKVPLALVLIVGASDLIFAASVSLASQAFTAFEMLGKTAQIGVVLAGSRAVCALALYLWVPHTNAHSWAALYLASTVFSALCAFVMVCRRLGYPQFASTISRSDLREGFHFSLSVSSQSVYNNIDKAMLVRLATLEAAGIYATAYRVVDLALQPVSSLLYSTFAKFFQHGSRGIEGSSSYARRILPIAAGYGVLAGIVLFVAAPILPLVIGASFHGTDTVLRWLSPLILIRAVHYLLANSLTGADLQGLRSGIQLGVAAFNIAMNIWLIPAYSWRGAAWASLASDGLLAVSMWVVITLLRVRSRRESIGEPQTKTAAVGILNV
jgi:O-antigen/teichoic acid export membrane protein